MQTVETLIDIAGKSIRNGEPVWFGCEVGKHTASKQGILDLEAHDYQLVFDTRVNLNMNKAQRLIYGDSLMNHAMVLTGISVQDVRFQQLQYLTPFQAVTVCLLDSWP